MGMLAKGTPIWSYSLPVAILASAVLTSIFFGSLPLLLIHVALLVLMVPPLLFFRDPERPIGEGIVSPADGKVREVGMRGGRAYVSIFMNVHNVHVNRAPMDCRVTRVEHLDGGFIPAFKKESERNERVRTLYHGKGGSFEVVQIAGTVARRIVPYISEGDRLAKGDRIGLIRFGSRVDMTFTPPSGYRISVREGDRVLAGSTTIAASKDIRGHYP